MGNFFELLEEEIGSEKEGPSLDSEIPFWYIRRGHSFLTVITRGFLQATLLK